MTAATSASGTTRRRPAGVAKRHTQHKASLVALLAPFFVLFALLTLLPVGFAVYKSLFRIARTGGTFGKTSEVFAGVSQYVSVLSDPVFLGSVGRVMMIGIVQVPIMLGAALGLALLLDSNSVRGRKAFRLIYFLPYGIPGVAAIVMWAVLYSPGRSPIVDVLSTLGIQADFLGAAMAPWSIANILTFSYTGYNMLIIYSALQGISGDLYEAASLDGAGPIRIAWAIKTPIVMPAIILTGVFSIIGTMQLFAEPYVLRTLTPNIDSSYTPTMIVFRSATTNYSYSAAAAVLLAVGSFALSFGFLKLTERRMA